MKKLQSILESPWAIGFGETILHSLWQGAIILAVYWLLTKKWKDPQSKVNLGLFALLSQVLVSGITLALVFASKVDYTTSQLPLVELVNQEFSFSQWISANSPYLFAAWLIGFTFLSVKYTFSLVYVQWLRRSHQSFLSVKASRAWHELIKKVSIEGFKIQLFESTKVSTAMVIGHLKPMILIPVAMVNYLTVEQLEVVLAHELAHIKRNDFLVNLFQTLVESIYFFHPIYWFIGNQIRENRELACDSLAAKWTGNGVLLAKTLAKIQLSHSQPEFAMAFGKKKMPTLNRIENLLGYQSKNQRSKFFALLLMCSMITAFGFMPQNQEEYLLEKQDQAGLLQDTVLENPVFVADTGIVTRKTIYSEKMNIKTDNFDVNMDGDGITLNGQKVEMTPGELAAFKLKWKNLQNSQREIEKMSEGIEKESAKIEAIHSEFEFNFDPSDDPNFKEYVAVIEKSGEELGALATKMSEEIMKLDRNDKDYNKKSGEITKAFSENMKSFQQTIQEKQPLMEKWQAEMERKQEGMVKQMEKTSIKEVEGKLKVQTDAILKVAEQLEEQHDQLLNFLPSDVRNEIESSQNIHMNYPNSLPQPPAPPMPPVTKGKIEPISPPKAAAPPAPPKPKKD